MKRFIIVFLCMIFFAGNVHGFVPEGITEERDFEVTFIVEVEGEPVLVAKETNKYRSTDEIKNEISKNQAQVMTLINDNVSQTAEMGYVYTSLFNGFSMKGKMSDREEIKSLPGVKNVYISQKTPVPELMINSAESMSGVYSAHNIGFSGKGQVVAVIDSFCDTGHDFFAEAPEDPEHTREDIDEILKTNTLNSGVTSANQVYKSEKIPYAYDYISNSSDTYSGTAYHGTHVSGIAVGKNGKMSDGTSFSGVAYDSQLIFMNVAKDGYIYDSTVFAAVNDAAVLEADVINMSFGADYLDSDISPAYETVINNAKKSGISVIAAAGNRSRGYNNTPLTENPDYSTLGVPGGFSGVTAVASADNIRKNAQCWGMKLDNETELDFYPAYQTSTFEQLFSDAEIEYTDCGFGQVSDFTNKDLTGKIALIARGNLAFTDKSDNAKNAGAVGIIIINDNNEIINTVDLSLPAAIVSNDTGKILLKCEEKRLRYEGEKIGFVELSGGGKISDYSSWGVDSSLELKPEITAPGGNIYSSYPDNKYVYASGTSMASPHMAGVAAILRQFYETEPYREEYNNFAGEKLVSLIENISMGSAEIITQDNGIPYSPRVQGAGMVNVENAINNRVLLTGNSGKAKVSLGEISDEFNVTFNVTNISGETVVFDKISLEVLTDGYKEEKGHKYVSDSIKAETSFVDIPESVIVNPGETTVFEAVVCLDKNFTEEHKKVFENGFFVDGFVKLESSDGKNRVSLPFTGFYGAWYDLPVFDSTTYDEGGSGLADSKNPYTTGTFLKMYIDDDTYFHVGRNMVDNKIADKKYISFSNKSERTLALALKNYRSVSNFLFTITDENNNNVYSQRVNTLCNKFSNILYTFNKSKMSVINEGEYIIRAEATVNGNSRVNDVLELPLVIDNTPPEIVSVKYENEALTVYAKDNHYPAYIYLKYLKKDGAEEKRYIPLRETDTVEGITKKTVLVDDIEGLDSAEIAVCDYAMNIRAERLSVLTDKIGTKVEEFIQTEGVTSVKVVFYNNTDEDIKTDTVIAYYDENSRLIAVSVKKASELKKDVENIFIYSMLKDTNQASRMKIFLWQPETMIPIDNVKRFDISK